jgi:diguanylate cyclase (GGDEF)-like protein
MPARVLLIESDLEQQIRLRDALAEGGIEVVGEASGASEALALAIDLAPDVVLVDTETIGGPAAIELARSLRRDTDVPLVFISMAGSAKTERVADLVAVGARAYVVRDRTSDIVAAVNAVHDGTGFLSPEATRPVLDEVSRLYERERVRNDELEELVRQLQDLSVTDWLTGLKNHGFYFERLSEELDRGLRHRRPLSVAIADIDDFKAINDTRGHAAGDHVLQEVSRAMTDAIRSADVLCRIGGEEFGFILPETDSEGALLVAERIRESIAERSITGVGRVTVSIGVASVPEHAVDRDEIMEAADRALYLAKRQGKNRTRVSGEVVNLTAQSQGSQRGVGHIVDLLVRVLRLRGADLAGHAERSAEVAVSLGAHLHLNTHQLEHLRVAALLQDVGKIGVPDAILYKQGPLTPKEWEVIQEHPKKGFELVGGLVHPEAAEAVLSNHERFDGKGYPHGLQGQEIPLLARVLLVADAYSAMTGRRPFREPMQSPDAMKELRRHSGTQFDPGIVNAMSELIAAMQPELETDAAVVAFPESRAAGD